MFFSSISVFLDQLKNNKKFTILLTDNTYFYEIDYIIFIKNS